MKCHYCDQTIFLQCNDDNPKRIDGDPVCKRCYYEKLGEFIEDHPVGMIFYRDFEYTGKKITNNSDQE